MKTRNRIELSFKSSDELKSFEKLINDNKSPGDTRIDTLKRLIYKQSPIEYSPSWAKYQMVVNGEHFYLDKLPHIENNKVKVIGKSVKSIKENYKNVKFSLFSI